jgi:hypothetical protein
VAVAAVGGADREDRLGPVAQRLADADEQPGRERDGVAAGVLEHLQAHRRDLVGAAACAGTSAVVSSIIPSDGATGLSRWISPSS